MKNLKKSAFSLIELSIVILIIGILIAGITQSSRLIRQMKLTSARSLTESSPVASIKGLVLWLETTGEKAFSQELEDGATLPLGGKWLDRNPQSSSKADAFTSASQNPPIYIDNCINDLPCFSFSSANSNVMNVTQGLGNPEGLSIFVIYKTPDNLEIFGNAGGVILNTSGDNGAGSGHFAIEISRQTTYYRYNEPPGDQDDSNITDVDFMERSSPYILGVISNSSAISDGISTYSGSNGAMRTLTRGLQERPNLNNGLNIGYYNNDQYLDGFISEIIIFDRALKNEERISVQNYLAKKWGIKI